MLHGTIEIKKIRCSTCKFWLENSLQHPIKTMKINLCQKPVEFWDASEWTRKEVIDEKTNKSTYAIDRTIKEEYKDVKMFTQDGSDYRADLFTREDFFCAHWEPNQ